MKGAALMLAGVPDRFEVLSGAIGQWNRNDSFCNGVLLFCIAGRLFPCERTVATLRYELPRLKAACAALLENERLYSLPKEAAFAALYGIVFPEDWNARNDFRFDLSPAAFADRNCYVFAVRCGEQARILAAGPLKYLTAESRHELTGAAVLEAVLPHRELCRIFEELNTLLPE